jgi:hypothetical protein
MMHETPNVPAAYGLEESPNDGDLFGTNELRSLVDTWDEIQAGFIDDPRGSVARADQLVQHVTLQLQQSFARRRQELERQWANGGSDAVASTEQLRTLLQRYRSFFQRLLALQPVA